jgi:hypothetical protein
MRSCLIATLILSVFVARQNFIRAKMVDAVVSPFPRATFHVSTS